MNIVKISGSIGEQMFQYAFFLRMIKNHPDAKINPSNRWIAKMFPGVSDKKIASPQQLNSIHKSLRGSISNLLSGSKCIGKDYKENEYSYKPDALEAHTDTYFDGKWLSYRYFDSITKDIEKAFSVPTSKLAKGSQSLIKVLEKENESVAIHIHRPTSKQNTCTKDYYNWAITHIRNFIENPFFVVITDDVKWAESNLILNKNEHICINAPAYTHYSVISLFNHAKHNIIANTLESWWAAWLNPNPDKIVIAPKEWSRNQNYPDLIPYYWISIPTT